MISFIAGAASLVAILQGHAHVHGHAELALALDGEGALFVELQTPMDNVYGFEREPRNDVERAHVADVNATLADGANWIDLGRANCTLETAEIEQASDHGHGNIRIALSGQCEREDRMSIDLQGLFDRFAGLEEVELVVLSPTVQQGFELSPSRSSVRVGG